MFRPLALVLALLSLVGCTDDKPGVPSGPPPFAVRDDSSGLLLVYGDAEGFHTVERVADVPVASRTNVRVDSLSASPDRRLDAQFVWVADLRRKGSDGTYPVRALPREEFERLGSPAAPRATGSGEVVVYGASWCGVCRRAEAYFRSKGVAFVEKDIEREPGARDEMMAKARAAGVSTNGIPVIDVRGTILAGFDPQAIDRALR
jgi:glutaredoxin